MDFWFMLMEIFTMATSDKERLAELACSQKLAAAHTMELGTRTCEMATAQKYKKMDQYL